MKTLKIISATAAILIISLVITLMSIQNPIEKQFHTTLHAIMAMKGYDAEEEAFAAFPELVAIKADLKIKALVEYNYKHLVGNPIPPCHIVGSEIRSSNWQELKSLEESIKNRLTKILQKTKMELVQL